MNQSGSVLAVAVICGVVLLIALLQRKAQFLLNFCVRGFLGGIGIYMINSFFAEQGIALAVGLNPISLLTTGALGFSGLALLYVIVALDFL